MESCSEVGGSVMTDSNQRGKYYQTAKRHVQKSVLEPVGFVKGKHLYIREVSNQVHGIGFQAHMYGGSYFVNLAFHYNFIPGFFGGANDPALFYETDFLFGCRLEQVIRTPDNKPQWYYGNSVEETEADLAQNAHNAIKAMDVQRERWHDPKVFLKAVPPELIWKEISLLDEFERRQAHDINLSTDDRKSPLRDILGDVWSFSLFPLTLSLATIALREKNRSLAESYQRIFDRVKCHSVDMKLANEFAKRLDVK
jgi:hypothetical protein